MVGVGVEDETWRDFLSFPDSEPPAAATPGQAADAAHWESFSTRKQRSTSVFPVRTNSSHNMYGLKRQWHQSAYPESSIGKTTTSEQTPGVVVATLYSLLWSQLGCSTSTPVLCYNCPSGQWNQEQMSSLSDARSGKKRKTVGSTHLQLHLICVQLESENSKRRFRLLIWRI